MSQHSLSSYERAVKSTLIVAYTENFINQLDPDDFVISLHRLFQRKQKAMIHLALYVQKEVEERGKPLRQTLDNISFFAHVLHDYLDRDCGQPVLGHT